MVRTPTCSGQVGALIGCLRFNKTPRQTRISIPVSPSSCSDLEELIERSTLGSDPESREWISIRVGLEFIQTFLEFVCEWCKRYEIVRKQLGDLVSGIEAAFEKAGLEFGRAFRKRDAKQLDAVRSILREKIELFKPRIRESYDFFFEYAFQSTSSFTPIAGYLTWSKLCRRLRTNASRLKSEFHLGTPMFLQFQDVVAALEVYGENSMYQSFYSESSKNFRLLVEGVGICLAGLLFLWWVDNQTDEVNKTMMLSNLLQRIKPSSPQLLHMYLESFSAQWNPTFGIRLSYLVRISIIPSKEWIETLHDGLLFLLRYLCDPIAEQSPEQEELQRSRMVRLICDAASRNYFSTEPHDDEELVLLLQKIELLKLELVTMALEKGHYVPKTTFNSIRKGFRFLQTFLGRTTTDQDVNSEKLILIFKRIEKLATEGKALRLILKGKQIHDDARKCKLVLLFKLTNIHCLIMENMRCKPSLMFPVKNKCHTLHEGLELFYKHISVLSWDKSDAKKMILSCKDKIMEVVTPICFFFQSNQLTDDTINEISSLLSTFLRRVNLLNSHIQGRYHRSQCSSVSFPKTHQGLGFIDLFWENLSRLMNNLADSIGYSERAHIEPVLRELDSLRSLLEEVEEKRIETPQLKDLRRCVTQVAYQADYIIDRILLVKCDWYHLLWLSNVTDEMKVIKSELTRIMQINNDFAEISDAVQTSEHNITGPGTLEAGEVVISLKDQEEIIIHLLQRGSTQRRQVVTVVGMPGIGKTTLARKVYENPKISNYFHRRAWCCVTQHYRRRELLLKILGDIVETTNGIDNKTDEDLIEMLYKSLKGYRYLVVMDDVWSSKPWEELGSVFPDDSNGSRILFTSRSEEVALKAQHDGVPHPLRFLTEEESWRLLKEKVFSGEDKCPVELKEVGKLIAKSCEGLPLAIVAIAGVLKRTERKVEQWKKIEKDLDSLILEDPEHHCMRILEMSYNHLPEDLKPCFLYFAAFKEDNEVPVQKLIQLWTAEGFIRRIDLKASLENVAHHYVMDLISRSLLMVAKRGSDGGVKACKVHDMMHSLCLRKVEEENFLQRVNGYENLFPVSGLDYGHDWEHPPVSIAYEQHRLIIHAKRKHFALLAPSGAPVRTLLFFATTDSYPRCPYDVSFIVNKFKLLRVLDIESINIGSSFPKGIELLIPLRYLAISGNITSIPSKLATKLWNLETFIVNGLMGKVTLPDTIWKLSSLRHLHVRAHAAFKLQDGSLQGSSLLDNLVTLSTPVLSHGDNSEEILKRFPRLRRLGVIFSAPAQLPENCIRLPVMDFLTELESLKIIYRGSELVTCQFSFPLNLQKLSLSDFSLTWDDFSAIGELPNLRILKLVSVSFDSETWDMKDNEFQQLECLKLDSLKIVYWNASSDHLPNLQRLVLQSCTRLQEVPSCFGESNTLQTIELKWCSAYAENSVRIIQEQQLEYGNDGFKIIINVPDAYSKSSL